MNDQQRPGSGAGDDGDFVYFATNRYAMPKDKPTRFTHEFNEHGMASIRLGKATVRDGELTIDVAPERLRFDAEKRTLDRAASRFGSAVVLPRIRALMGDAHCDTLVFVHGYNVSFEAAMKSALRLQQRYAAAAGGKGINVVAFSWPSDGSMMPWLAYGSDRRDAAASGPALGRSLLMLRSFLSSIDLGDCSQKVHLLCHSMGNYVLRHAVQEMVRQVQGRMPRLFDQVILAAPDEDEDAFEHDYKLARLTELCQQVTVYFNRNDRAMSVSDVTKGNPDRLGATGLRLPAQTPVRVSAVDVTKVVKGIVEHSYHVDSDDVVADVVQVLDSVDPWEFSYRRWRPERNHYELERQERST